MGWFKKELNKIARKKQKKLDKLDKEFWGEATWRMHSSPSEEYRKITEKEYIGRGKKMKHKWDKSIRDDNIKNAYITQRTKIYNQIKNVKRY